MNKINKTIQSPLTISTTINDEIAATSAEIDHAIEIGIPWLAGQQNDDGSWGDTNHVSVTGLAVLKLEDYAIEQGLSPLDPSYDYYQEVLDGLNYIFSQAVIIPINEQPAGHPDSSGSGSGVHFGNDNDHQNYHAGIALMAIAGSTLPDEIVSVPSGSVVNGWPFKVVAQEVVDYLAWAQTDSGSGRGGWDYKANDSHDPNSTTRSDNSISGWVTLGLAFAESAEYNFNCTIPDFVKNELNIWIDYIQTDVTGGNTDGGSGYSAPNYWVNILKTGNLLQQMAFYGDTAVTLREQNAIDYIVRHWNDDDPDPGWKGFLDPEFPANYQATFTVMKGLESLGIDIIGGIDWFEEISDVLVAEQYHQDDTSPDYGSWPSNCEWGTDILCTVWALLTLEKVVPAPPATRGIML